MGFRTTAAVTATALVLGGAYLTLDVLDLAPGTLTLRPEIVDPRPFPTLSVEEQLLSSSVTTIPAAAGNVSGVVDDYMADPLMGGLRAATVIDASTGEILANRNGSTTMPPASSTKILTAAAALSTIGPETRLATTATLSGDRLTLVGGGDVLLTTGTPEPGNVRQASLTDLAAQTATALKAAGTTEVSLAVDGSLFTSTGYSDEWDDRDRNWVMPIAAIAVDLGWIEGTTYESDPALAAARIFAEELSSQGITVAGEPAHGTSPEDATQVGAIRSAPVAEIVRYMLKVSENSVTEVMGLLTAVFSDHPATFAGSSAAIKDALTERGLPTESLRLGDACGLSTNNAITSDLLAETVRLSLSEPSLTSMISSFPVTYLDGTLADRGQSAAGLVRAKTGTLVTVVSLTGVVHAQSGAVLVFAAIASETENNWDARVGIDAFAANLQKVG